MTEAPLPPPPPGHRGHEVGETVAALRSQLERLERLIDSDVHPGPLTERIRVREPSWLRAAQGEERWPVSAAVVVAIALQPFLPGRLTIRPEWLLPVLEGALAIGLFIANPRHIDRRSKLLRMASITLIALTSVANGWSSFELVRGIIDGTMGQQARPLLSTGVSIWLTNVIVFALWYWEWDRGGPVTRAMGGGRPYPDFLFPQMTVEHLAPDDWRPTFADYFYVSYTNATAFSPTDVMPLVRWAKMLMLAQSAIALVTVALVVARAVNILK